MNDCQLAPCTAGAGQALSLAGVSHGPLIVRAEGGGWGQALHFDLGTSYFTDLRRILR